jgi:PRTRC genetic system ThiF family protein
VTETLSKNEVTLKRYLQSPPVPITVALIGGGGTGSMLLTELARISTALHAIDGRQLRVTLYDADTVSEANRGRQMFAPCDVGRYKADVLIERVNRFFGLNWESKPHEVNERYIDCRYNIVITCTDTKKSRRLIGKEVARVCNDKYNQKHGSPTRHFFWLDCGNTLNTGNVIIGSPDYGWPNILEHKAWENAEDRTAPSCSIADALTRQDLFINRWVATYAGEWLWQFLRQKRIDWRGAFVNLEAMRFRKIPV